MGLFGSSDLVMTVDTPYTQTILHQINGSNVSWAGYTFTMQARLRDGTLVGILDPFLTVQADPTNLLLNLPVSMVNALGKFGEAYWDILATPVGAGTAFRAPTHRGRIVVLQGVSRV